MWRNRILIKSKVSFSADNKDILPHANPLVYIVWHRRIFCFKSQIYPCTYVLLRLPSTFTDWVRSRVSYWFESFEMKKKRLIGLNERVHMSRVWDGWTCRRTIWMRERKKEKKRKRNNKKWLTQNKPKSNFKKMKTFKLNKFLLQFSDLAI